MKLNVQSMLKIYSKEMTPQELNKQIGVHYSKCRLVGDKISPQKNYEVNVWILNSKALPNNWPEEHLQWFKNALIDAKENLRSLPKECYIECSVVIECNQEPPLSFSTESIQFLGEIGASLDIDQYIDFPSELEAEEKE